MTAIPNPTRVGQINLANSTEAIFLKVFTGLVKHEFERRITVLPNIDMMMAPPGAKSIQVPYVGRAHAVRHEVGANMLLDDLNAYNFTPSTPDPTDSTTDGDSHLSQIAFGEREIFIDDPLKANSFLDDWEGFKSQLDAQQRVARELGRVLAEDNDIIALQLISKSARPTADGGIAWASSSIPTVYRPASDGANLFVDANAATDGSVLLGLIQNVAEAFDNARVPEEDRYVALAPAHYNLLVNNQDLLNRDFGGANGIFSDGSVFKAWGMTLLKSLAVSEFTALGNTEAQTVQTGVRGTTYNVDGTGTVAVCWQREGIAGVRGGDMGLRTQELLHYSGTLLSARLATGYECLRPLHAAVIGTT